MEHARSREEARREAGDSVAVISEGRGVTDQENAHNMGPGHGVQASPQTPFNDLLSLPARPALAVGNSPPFSLLCGATIALLAHVLTRTSTDAKSRVLLANQSGIPTAPRPD
jgi:hypothetical protein